MKKAPKEFSKRAFAATLSAAMVVGMCPSVPSFAVSSTEIAELQDGTYTGTAVCTPNRKNEFDAYNLTLKVTIAGGKITAISDISGDGTDDNEDYLNDAINGYTEDGETYTGIVAQILSKQSTDSYDTVSGATRSSRAIVEAVNDALAKDVNTVNVEILNTTITTAETKLASETETDYTKASWDALQTKLAAAKALVANPTTQDAVDSAANELNAAVTTLVKAATTEELQALDDAIKAAEEVKEDDYSEENWTALQETLTTAKVLQTSAADGERPAQTEITDATKALSEAVENKNEEDYKYVYAALTYAEYYAAEDVQAAGSTVSSDVKDTNGEYDKGAFDAVTRATTNHGLHRGNFQQDVTIYDTEGNGYEMAYWSDQTHIVLTDGSTISFSKGVITLPDSSTKTMSQYKITGIKYVPVKVATEDYDAFKEKYNAVENGETLAGGYSEGKLSSYAGLVAAVDANTNGLKTATKNADGTFSFGARQTGTGSGIEGVALKTATPTAVVQNASKFGDFIRMDIKENYGDIGANMQTVVWKYYGDGDTVLATYGTKFASDNWMHKSMGVQLGLTDSLRCQLPADKDGTGKWTVTIYALGYEDITMTINVTESDIHTATPVSDTSKLEAAIAAAEALNKDDYTESSWSDLETELQEAKDDLANAAKGTTSQESVDESTTHLNGALAGLVTKTEVPSDSTIATENKVFADGVVVPISMNVPDDSNYLLVSVEYAGKVLTEGVDYEYGTYARSIDRQLIIHATDNTGVGTYTLTFADAQYKNIVTTFTLSENQTPGQIDTQALETLIAQANTLKEAGYTSASWQTFSQALNAAKTALAAKESQDSIDQAAAALQSAMNALEKVPETTESETTETKEPESESETKAPESESETKAPESETETKAPESESETKVPESETKIPESESESVRESESKESESETKKASTAGNSSVNKSTGVKTGDPTSIFGLLSIAISSLGAGGIALTAKRKMKKKDRKNR